MVFKISFDLFTFMNLKPKNRVISKVKKTPNENLEFGRKRGEIKQKHAKQYYLLFCDGHLN